MQILIKIVLLLVYVIGGYLLAHRVIPWLFVRAGRLLGFRMKLTPLSERRVRHFRRIRRGYFSFVILTTVFVMSLGLELFCNHRALYIRYQDHWQAPAVASVGKTWLPWVTFIDTARNKDFGLEGPDGEAELDYRQYNRWVHDPATLEEDAVALEEEATREEQDFRAKLAEAAAEQGSPYDPDEPLPGWKTNELDALRAKATSYRALREELEAGAGACFMPLLPYSADERLLQLPGSPPHRPFQGWGMPPLGTDSRGIDLLSQLLYGFRISFLFAVTVSFIGYLIGVLVGGAMGYFGGWFDILVQRIIEVWSSIPFLFTMMILAYIMRPSFLLLAVLLVLLRAWIGITYTVRGEFYREKARDYVQAARAIGVRDTRVMTRHILPNALVPVVTFLPFELVAYIGALVSLDYLGFGLPPGTPSWGTVLRDGHENVLHYPHLVGSAVIAFAGTLFLVVTIGEAVREAFDPKTYSRLR